MPNACRSQPTLRLPLAVGCSLRNVPPTAKSMWCRRAVFGTVATAGSTGTPNRGLPMVEGRRSEVLRRFFSGVTEYAFCTEIGVADPPLVDYLSEMLVRFVRNEEIYSVRDVRGKRLDRVADMLAEAQQRQGPARRQVHRQIGDFILFWTGLYPEVIDSVRQNGGKDSLIDYPTQGKRAYYIASTIAVDKEYAPSEVLERLSQQFELCVYGLSEVRRQWEERDGDSRLLVN